MVWEIYFCRLLGASAGRLGEWGQENSSRLTVSQLGAQMGGTEKGEFSTGKEETDTSTPDTLFS
jgi:hypothetical protein